ncbi:alkene reductase [Nocardia aobensis]|uniref:alkene reductase n=1 Tax=Nocardia aobensis TaxID=257277 RepID=UPI0005684A34|nr:alkene reductase [Nocardia aobensis]
MPTAFEPFDLVDLHLANRIVMAPMTRNRADLAGVPTELMATYYSQRASAGLIVTEGTYPCPEGQGYPCTPGLHTADQTAAWRVVTHAVHANGGLISAQLMHAGRISHRALLADSLVPVAPSAVRPAGQAVTLNGLLDYETPEALTESGIEEAIASFVLAARNAVDAGFDAVEIHGANGYLIHQFLADNANLRTDRWGGSPQGRARFAVDVARAVTEAIGPERVGFRISPGNPYNDIVEKDQEAVYGCLVAQLDELGLAYLHVAETTNRELTVQLRKQWAGGFILNPSTERDLRNRLQLVEDGIADLVAFGSSFLANPDLPLRLLRGGPFNDADPGTFYQGGEQGYIDYPTLH